MKHEKPPPPSRPPAPATGGSPASPPLRPPTSPPSLPLAPSRPLDEPPIPLSVSALPTSNFECITGPPPNLFHSPVRWRYNDHRRMNHGPAETCIFMSAAQGLSLPVTELYPSQKTGSLFSSGSQFPWTKRCTDNS